MSLSKFSGPDLDRSKEFTHPDVWEKEVYPGWRRLVIGAREQEIGLILELCRGMRGPFAVLFVLLVPRAGHAAGRYESAPVPYEDLELFLYTFQEFLEQDGRHHVWVIATSDEGRLVFDHHNVVFAYGDLDAYEAVLRQRGFRESKLPTPAPHGHNYHAAFDASESEILSYWRWIRHPLEEGDVA
jgi:hypothetical protein